MRRFEDVVINQNGQPVGGALVTVLFPGTQTPATLYSDDGLTTIPNPVVTNSLASGNPGLFSFFIASGKYDFRVSGGNIQAYTQANVQIDDIFEFKVTDKQPWQTQTLEFSNQGAGATPPLGNVNLYSKLSDKNLYYKDDTGREVGPLGGGGSGGTPAPPINSLQKNNAGVFGAALATDDGLTFAINEDSQFKGSNPWADVRAFGKFGTLSSTTANTTAGSALVTLATAQNFKNGEYITIYNAGPSCGLATPAAPTVTPSANGGGVVAVPAGNGGLSFAYSIVAADKFGCYTQASTAGTTAAGNTLGVKTLAISTMSRVNNVVTVNTTTTHGLVVGQLAHIRYFTTSDGSFEGFWIVATVPTSTSFTFQSGMDTHFGATLSATGGAITAFNNNYLTWTAVPNAWKYYIYGRSGGTFALLGQSLLPNWTDYGSPMNDNQLFPTYIPTTAPITGANDHLTAKINSGAGSLGLSLSVVAGATTSGRTAISDDGPALIAAALSASSVYISSQGLSINSYTIVPSGRYYKLGGDIFQTDTIESGGFNTWEGFSYNTGGGTSFSWSGAARIGGNVAYPQMVIGGTSNFSKLQFGCGAPNGCLNTVDSLNTVNTSFEYVQFISSGGGQTDYIGMNQLFYGGGFTFRYNKCVFATGGPGSADITAIGMSPVPSVQFLARSDGASTGNVLVSSSWFTIRGSMNLANGPNGLGSGFIGKDLEAQSLVNPFLQFSRSQQFGIGVSGGIDLENILGADRATAYVANYQVSPLSGLWLKGASGGTGGRGILTGLPFTGIVTTSAGPLGHNTGYLSLNSLPSVATDGVIQATSLGFPMPTPSAGPGVVVSAGGAAFPTGTFPYVVQFLDANGFYGAQSPATVATTVGGNATVTITRPTAPTGAVSWVPFVNGGAIPCFPIPVATTTYVFNTTACSGTNPAPVGLAVSLGQAGVGTPTLTLWNNGFTSQTDFPTALTVNRNLHVPNATGTLALVNSAVAGQVLQWNGTSAVGLTAPAGSTVYNATTSAAATGITNTPMVTAPADGNYLFDFNLVATSNPTGCSVVPSFKVTLVYTDPFSNIAFAIDLPIVQANSSTFALTPSFSTGGAQANPWTSSYAFRAKTGTGISYGVTYFPGTGCSTGANYSIAPNLTQQ